MKKALIQLHAAVFLWGFTGILGRAITLNATLLVWYRLLITAVTLWVIYGFFKNRIKTPHRSILMISLIGTVQALHWVCFYASIQYANVTIALTCLSTSALFSAVLEPVVLKKAFSRMELMLGMLALAGIAIIYNSHLQFSIGILIGLVSALLTVIVSVLNKKIVDDYAPEQITLYQLTGGFLGLTLLLPFYLWIFPPMQLVPEPLDWVWLLVLSWVCTILTFFLYIFSLKKISAFTMNLVLTLEPVYGIILAFAVYQENEHLSRWFYPGFALIAASVALHMWLLLSGNRKTASVETTIANTSQQGQDH